MKKFSVFLSFAIFGVAACDLQPKIVALPDTVGEFITSRYPALLADPTSQPEIYNSAATDYGVYASPELYGSPSVDDYVLYASVDDYIVPPQPAEEPDNSNESTDDDIGDFSSDDVLVVPEQQTAAEDANSDDDDIAWDENAKTDDKLNIPTYSNDAYTEITIVRGDTLYMIGKKYNMKVEELASLNNLNEPYKLSVGQKLRVRTSGQPIVHDASKVAEQKPTVKQVDVKPDVKADAKPAIKADVHHNTTTRVAVDSVTVEPGDTLYSLSRKYSVPVNDLAVMNNLTAPFGLYAGQKLKVPNLSSAPVRNAMPSVKTVKNESKQVAKSETKQSVKPEQVKAQPKQATQKKQTKPDNKPKQKPVQQTDKKQTTPAKAKTNATPVAAKKPAIVARSSSKFSWPVRGKILSNYGAKTNGLFNDGINIGASAGSTVVAAENGVVAYAGNEVKGMGNLVIIQHSDGWMTVYAHMDSMSVRRGARVGVGQKIGTVGKTGKVDKPQLHFEVRKGTKAYNPIQYLKK